MMRAPGVLSLDRLGDRDGTEPAASHESHHRAERAGGGRPEEVQPGHRGLHAALEYGIAVDTSDLSGQVAIEERIPVDVDVVAGREQQVVNPTGGAIGEGQIEHVVARDDFLDDYAGGDRYLGHSRLEP